MKIFLLLIIFVLFLNSPVNSIETEVKKAITITSQSLTINKKENRAHFYGNVIAKKDNMTVFADSMLVYYDETGTRIEKIEAEGNVKVIKDTRTIISEKATYVAADDSITFVGEPVAVDGKNIIKGDKIIYYISEDRSVVSNSRVYLKENHTDKDVRGKESN